MSRPSDGVPHDPPVVTLSGPVTIEEAPRHREALLAALASGRGLRIDLEPSGPWDVAGLQLLLAALASGRQSGQGVRLAGSPGVLRELAERAGVLDLLDAAG